MSAIITPKFRIFNAKKFIASLANDELVNAGSFVTGTTYTITTTGDTDFTVIGAANSDPDTVFTATGVGTGTGTATYATEKLYVGIGKPDVWATGDAAETVDTALSYSRIAYQSMTDMKKINTTDISHVMTRRDFDAAAVDFVPWNSNSATAFDDKFYCITTAGKVYKCVGKQNTATTPTEPIHTTTSPELSSGHWWQYMFTTEGDENTNFQTTVFSPVQTATAASTRLTHQNACATVSVTAGSFVNSTTYTIATAGTTDFTLIGAADSNPGTVFTASGAGTGTGTANSGGANTGIYHYEVVNGGTGYTASVSLTCTVTGDGFGAAATLQTNSSGVITGYTITTAGTGYTYAAIEGISGGGSGAVIRPSVAPGLGHGTDPVEELGGHYVVAHAELAGSAATVNNDFRQLSLILNPIEDDGNTLANAASYRPMRRLTVTAAEADDFVVDQIITEATSGAQGRVVDIDVGNGYIYYVQSDDYSSSDVAITTGTGFTPFTGGEALTSSSGSAASSTITGSPIKTGSGDIIFLENLSAPVERATNQTEDIKIVIEF